MTDYNARGTRGDLTAYLTSGTPGQPLSIISAPDNGLGTLFTGLTFPGAGTFVAPVGSENSAAPVETPEIALHLRWAAAVAGTVTLEVSNHPRTMGGDGRGGVDLSDWDVSGFGGWVPFNPTPTGSLYAAATGTGNSFTALVLTLGGTNAGGAVWNLPSMAFKRLRMRFALTVGGLARPSAHAKLGA